MHGEGILRSAGRRVVFKGNFVEGYATKGVLSTTTTDFEAKGASEAKLVVYDGVTIVGEAPPVWYFDPEQTFVVGAELLVDVKDEQETKMVKGLVGNAAVCVQKVERVQNWKTYNTFKAYSAGVLEKCVRTKSLCGRGVEVTFFIFLFASSICFFFFLNESDAC